MKHQAIKFKWLISEYDVRSTENTRYPLMSVSQYLGVVPRSELKGDEGRAESTENYKTSKPGQIVLNRMSAASGALGLATEYGLVSPDYAVLQPSNFVEPEYLYYLMKSDWFTGQMVARLKGIGAGGESASVRTPRVNISDLGDIDVNLPPIEEQRRIADYLDVETKRIQELIKLKKNLVAKYDELFNSVRNYLVVGKPGIGSVKNGEEWFSSVPSHWIKKPLRLLFSWQKGKDPARLDATYCGQNPGPFPVYSGQTSNDGIFGQIDTYDFDFKVECNLITTVGARAGSMKVLNGKFSLSQNCALLAPKSEEMSASYLNFLWPTIWNDLSSKIPSDMQPSVRLDDLKQICVYFPPEDEQREIVLRLKQIESEYLAARSGALASIDLYNEYMNAIVTEKVTGRFSESNAKAVS